MGDKILFYFLHVVITLISWLPFWCLYRISDALYLLVYYLLRYRKKVVRQNLRAAFPDRPLAEVIRWEREFYHYFCDLLVETVKLYTLSDQELKKRVHLENIVFANAMLRQQKGALLWGSHYGNFEWMTARLDLSAREFGLSSSAVYTPIKQPALNKLLLRLREKRGVQMLPMRRAMYESIKRLRQTGIVGMIGDQSPHHGLKLYFTPFLSRPTAFHTSIAKLILRTECLVFFVKMKRRRRGYYELSLKPIPTAPFLPETATHIQELTDVYVRELENMLAEAPPFWLWSHRRWKHAIRSGDELSPLLENAFGPAKNDE